MSTNFFDAPYNEELFVKEGVLNYSYNPDKILFRDDEQAVIAGMIKPLFRKQKPSNLLIYGKPGLGKTLCSLGVLKQLEDYSEDIRGVYINCWDFTSEHQLIIEIAKRLNYFFSQGKSSEEIFEEIINRVEDITGVVFIFDEIDKVKEYGFLYRILKDLEGKACIILITNNQYFLLRLEERISSRLLPSKLEFKPYSREQVEDILMERVNMAFPKGSVSNNIFRVIVNETFKNEDIRVGLFLLREIGKSAEQRSSKVVSDDDLNNAIDRLSLFKIKTSLSKLSADEKMLIDIVADNPGLLSGELFKLYKAKGGKVVERSYRRIVEKLERLDLLMTESISGGTPGQSRKIFLGKKLKHTMVE